VNIYLFLFLQLLFELSIFFLWHKKYNVAQSSTNVAQCSTIVQISKFEKCGASKNLVFNFF